MNSAWFAGPKAENAGWFTDTLSSIAWDYYFWRRNYFPEDSVVVGSEQRRNQDEFRDRFDDRLGELLGKLKADCPFYSPRYAGHMIAEQSLPSIAGYFAAMLYNPNNVSAEAATVTVKLEIEAAQMIAAMLGHGPDGWSHLSSGGTVANFEALWVARSVKYLPFVLAEVRQKLGLQAAAPSLEIGPADALADFKRLYSDPPCEPAVLVKAVSESAYNVSERGTAAIERLLESRPYVLAPETHHYCFSKAMDLLGLGRDALVRVKVDPEFRMDVSDLEAKLDWVQAQGGHVLAVVVVVGTTEEGAVDPVDQVLALRRRREAEGRPSFWLHADAAYGGYLRTLTIPERVGLGERHTRVKQGGKVVEVELDLPERTACDALESLGECDSITIDPHKLGYVPYPAGAVSFRTNAVKPLARQEAPYLQEATSDFRDEEASEQVGVFTLEGSKPGATAAAVWLSHRSIPLDSFGHGALVRDTVRNACELYALLSDHPEPGAVQAECLCRPGSNIVCYAFRPRGSARLTEVNALNKELYDRFSLGIGKTQSMYGQTFLVSRTTISPTQYSLETVSGFLSRMGVTPDEYLESGVFLLRSVLMNPWYSAAKAKDAYYLSEMVAELFRAANDVVIRQ